MNESRTAAMSRRLSIWLAVSLFALSGPKLLAQYQGEQQIGFTGLNAGSQAPPGIYVTIPLYWRVNDLSIYGAQNNRLLPNTSGSINLFMLPSFQVVTPFKILGANYGASFTQWMDNGTLSLAAVNYRKAGSYGYGDIYVQPISLGWHLRRADVTTGYAFFAPTGSDVHGFHMWVNELDLGTTVYLDEAKKYNVSTMMYYDWNREKTTTPLTVGNILTLSGGAARSFLKGAARVGVAYGAQWKVTRDSGPGIPAILPLTNGRVFGVGPAVQMPLFAKGGVVGLAGFQYEWLVGPKTAFGGQTLTATFTLAHLFQK